jgi:ABC-2 type transport system ATP-binding protein
MPEPAIRVENLRYQYRHAPTPALDGLDFSVGPGEIFGLLGPNGAGKSTAVKILTTILKPGGGRAFVGGRDVALHPLEARRQLAAVLQENAIETLLSVRDNLELYGRLHGLSAAETKTRAAPMIELLGLGDQLEKRAQTLSGGYKRRLQVTKALMIETPVLFLDEATTGMDPLIKRTVMNAIREQARRGRAVLLTTQLLDEAEALCDRMTLLHMGKSIASGRLAEIKGQFKKVFSISLGFTGADPLAVAALRELTPRKIEEGGGEILMTVEGREDEWIRQIAKISERWPLSHFEIRGASLEEIFIELYGAEEQHQDRCASDATTGH